MKNLFLLVLFIFPFFSYAQFSEMQIITFEISSPWSIFVVDIDGDGTLDVLATSEVDNKIVWFKNEDGLGNFEDQQIITQNLEYTKYVTAADLDGDGDMDVLATSASNDLLVWYENLDGLGTFSNQHIISSTIINPYKAIAVDVDSDNDLDIIAAFPQSNKIAWFENLDGLGNFSSQHFITNSAINVFSVDFADINGDGIKDVICDSSSNGNGYPSWYENDGAGNFGSQQEITQDTFGSIYVIADDLDGDGDMDVLNIEFGGETIAWYENTDGLGNFGPKRIIIAPINASFQIFTADLDNDGDKDIVYNSQDVNIDKVAWQENDGNGNFGAQQILTTDVFAPRGLFSADIDNDGDNDILFSSIGNNKIGWFENLTILGVAETLQLKIKVYPNPANTVLYISNSSTYSINSLQITDLQGKTVKQVNKNTSQLDISNLESGVYFVKILTDKGSLVKKIIKQ